MVTDTTAFKTMNELCTTLRERAIMISILKMRQHIAVALWGATNNVNVADPHDLWNSVDVGIRAIYFGMADDLIAAMVEDGTLPSTKVTVYSAGGRRGKS